MDNDNFFKRKVAKVYKSLKFWIDYRDIEVIPEFDGNLLIGSMLKSSTPFSVVRCGATEMRCVMEYLTTIKNPYFSKKIKKEIKELSGVFPTTDEFLKKFCEYYIERVKQSDLLVVWDVGAENQVVHRYCRDMKYTKLHALEPYYFAEPWSKSLKGKKVLVLHPFAESIKIQYEKRELLFKNKELLPEFKTLICIPAVQSIAGQKTEFENWFSALDFMCSEINKCDFDVAIIGAGAYGLPLATYVKSLGKQAIQMSGSTQILFGIKGNRWNKHPIISKLYNEYWIRPNYEETPPNIEKVEGGSYW